MKKKIASLLLVAVLGFSAFAQAKAGSPAKVAVSFNPLGLIAFMFPGSVEIGITDQISAKLDFVYSPNFAWVSNMSFLDAVGTGRFYFGSMLKDMVPEAFRGPALRGIFGGGKVSVSKWDFTYYTDYKASWMEIGFGAEAGTKYFLTGQNGWYAEGTLGFMVFLPSVWQWTYQNQPIEGYTYTGMTYSQTGLNYSLSMGFAF